MGRAPPSAGRAGQSLVGALPPVGARLEGLVQSMRLWPAALVIGLAAFALGGVGGCEVIGVMAESARREGSHDVTAEYTGLQGKSFVVLVAADRAIQANWPRVAPQLTAAITARIVSSAGPSGFVPPTDVLQYQYDTPRWTAMPYRDLMEHFDVDRLIFIDLHEFRLNDPGNAYLWEGRASAMVGIAERDGFSPDDFAFRKDLSVGFPDKSGYGPAEFTADQVGAVLRSRLTDRVAWLFYDHEEKNVITY